MKELVEKIVKAIVDDVDAVVIKELPGDNNSIIEIKTAKEDIGKVLGKKGRTANAIRSIVYASSFKMKKRYTIDIINTKE